MLCLARLCFFVVVSLLMVIVVVVMVVAPAEAAWKVYIRRWCCCIGLGLSVPPTTLNAHSRPSPDSDQVDRPPFMFLLCR